ncbi:MAG: glycosyltransferase [Bradymonadaceae bacterium]|nr:glycosyltransferase [Lujinxingiaceae bacterium]
MRIAFIAGAFPNLSQTFVLNQITGLIERGHEVDILASRPPKGGKEHPDVEAYGLMAHTYYWPKPSAFLGALARHPAQTLSMIATSVLAASACGEPWSLELVLKGILAGERGRYDIVLAHFGNLGREAQMLRDMGALDARLVTVFHGYDMSVFPREKGPRVYDRLFGHGELFLPISEHWRALLVEMGAPERRLGVHRMGIDCKRFAFAERAPDADGIVRIVTIGRLVEKKGVEYAIRAIAQLVEHHQNIEYVVVGDGPLNDGLQALIDELDVGKFVRLVGWMGQGEIVALLASQHLLLAPSVTAANGDKEGIPVVLMEAMAMGLPVVSTLHSGIAELVEDGMSGYLVAERDVDALAERLEALVCDPARWPAMGRAGRAMVEREFDVEVLNDRLDALLQTLVS